MANDPPKESDATAGAYRDDVMLETGAKAVRAAAQLQAKSRSDRNYEAPVPQYDPVTQRRYYAGAPIPIKRQFGSPLVQSGRFATGPHHEREITSTWGAPRNVQYGAHVADGGRPHGGVDFRAPVGEEVLASGDGTVVFVGFQRRVAGGPKHVVLPSVPDPNGAGTVVDQNGTVVALRNELGHGGVYVGIHHNGDFHGYITQYMHLSAVTVKEGDRVLQGAVIGRVGRSGGDNGIVDGPHLHWQVRLNGAVVRPDVLVPNYYPGHPPGGLQDRVIPPTTADATTRTVAEQVVHGQVLGQLQTIQRATDMENQARASRDTLRDQQGYASSAAAKTISVHSATLSETIAKFQATLPVVTNPMAFDFDKGVWTDDGKPV